MNYLFSHQNYPGQFKHIAGALAADPQNQVVALVDDANKRAELIQPNVHLVSYKTPQGASKTTHPYLQGYEASIRRGQQIARVCLELQKKRFEPDIVCAHAGWGEALFIKEVFPKAILLDEPTSALDGAAAAAVCASLCRLADVIPVVVVTHSNEMARLADHLFFIARQGLAANGPASLLAEGPPELVFGAGFSAEVGAFVDAWKPLSSVRASLKGA